MTVCFCSFTLFVTSMYVCTYIWIWNTDVSLYTGSIKNCARFCHHKYIHSFIHTYIYINELMLGHADAHTMWGLSLSLSLSREREIPNIDDEKKKLKGKKK